MISRCRLSGHSLRTVPHGFECSRPGCGYVEYRLASLRVVDDRKPEWWLWAIWYSLLAIGAIAVAVGLLA